MGSMPGRIINGLKTVAVNNPVFLLDEVDKLGKSLQGDPAAALLEVSGGRGGSSPPAGCSRRSGFPEPLALLSRGAPPPRRFGSPSFCGLPVVQTEPVFRWPFQGFVCRYVLRPKVAKAPVLSSPVIPTHSVG